MMGDMKKKDDYQDMQQDQENLEPGIEVVVSPREQRRKRLIRIALAGLVVALAACITYYIYTSGHQTTDDAFIEGHIVAISPRVSGHVAKVYVEDNQKVKAGDVLVELDPRDFQARLAAVKAAKQAAQTTIRSREIDLQLTNVSSTAGLDEAQADMNTAKSNLLAAQEELAVAKASLELAKTEEVSAQAKHASDVTDLERTKTMAAKGAVTEQQLDHAKTAEVLSVSALAAARQKCETQRASVRRAEAQVAARTAQLDQSRARYATARTAPEKVALSQSRLDISKQDVEKAGAEERQAELALSYTRIVAPADGFITKKSVEPGAFVQVGQALMALVRPDVWFTANYKETQLEHMRPGQPVEISVDTYSHVTLHGMVDSIQKGTGARFSLLPPENATGNYVKVVQRVPVKIVFLQNQEGKTPLLVPGMSVIADVDVGAKPVHRAAPVAEQAK